MEELCFYLYQHVYLIENSIITDSLIDWIGSELKLTDRAEKLKLLKQQKADLKTIITVILCSTDYYTEQEIKGLLKLLEEIIGMPSIRRNAVKADYLLKEGQYGDALGEYEQILDSKDASLLSMVEYGDILHNMAVAKVHRSNLKEASELFLQAYERNQREESLRQFLCAVRLSGGDRLYEEKALEYQVNSDLAERIEDEFVKLEQEANCCEGMADLHQLKMCKADGRMNEFYRRADEMLNSWKATIRQS
jgi:tetratricopeptide (TPR) repeat protein